MKYNPQLDSLRALAALAVIAYHYGVLPFGWVGVQFFFVLSGFLITGIVIKGKETTVLSPGNFFKEFYIRRIARLFPLYFGYISLLIIGYLIFKQPKVLSKELPWLLTYTLNFRWLFNTYTFHPFYGHLWSLALEWQFYLFWPFAVWMFPANNQKKIFSFLILAALLLRLCGYLICNEIPLFSTYHASADHKALAAYVLPFSHLDAFVFGALLYFKDVRCFLSKWQVASAVFSFVIIIGLILTFILPGEYVFSSLGWPTRMPLVYQWLWGYLLLNLLSAVILSVVMERKYLIFEFTNWSILQYLGKISYGIYVFHSAIVFGVHIIMNKITHFNGKNILGLFISIVLSVMISHVSFFYWEQRFIKKKR